MRSYAQLRRQVKSELNQGSIEVGVADIQGILDYAIAELCRDAAH
jgi:hypothetical protein